MAQPYLKGPLESLNIGKQYKSGSKFTATINGETLENVFGKVEAQEGDNVVVWENDGQYGKNYSIKVDTPREGDAAPAQAPRQASTAPKQSYTPNTSSFENKDAQITAQSATNYATQMISAVINATAAGVTNDVSGVTKAKLALYSDPDAVFSLINTYAAKYQVAFLKGEVGAQEA